MGGTFTTQNKVRPGVYVNFNSEPQAVGTLGERGIVTMALPLSWGGLKTVLTLQAGEDTTKKLGYAITDVQMLLIREALKRAKTLLLYRLNTGTAATVTSTTFTVTAKYSGVRGNDIAVTSQVNIDNPLKYDVKTFVAMVEVDSQTVATLAELVSNDWVVFSGTVLIVTAGLTLAGGTDGVVVNADHTDYLAAIELHDFQTMALVSTDASLKPIYAAFVLRLRDTEGKKIQVVMENYPSANYEGVISVKNGVILLDATVLTAAQATAWVAGATAGAGINQSLTYQAYDDAVDVGTRYTNSQIEAAITAGEFVFTPINGRVLVEYDINTLTSFTPTKGKAFSKNRVIRVLDGINNDLVRIFAAFYIGKVDNNVNGRNLFKNESINYLNTLQNISAIQNFNSQTDITVQAGTTTDGVYIETSVQPVDSAEKIYLKVTVA